MKTFCALATLAAATAVENTAPVISLSLENTEDVNSDGTTNALDHNRCNVGLNTTQQGCMEYANHVTAVTASGITNHLDASGNANVSPNTYNTGAHAHSFAAKGLVTATEAAFPEPTASAYDHHDASSVEIIKTYTYFVVSRPACNTFLLATESLAAPTSPTTANNALSAGTPKNTGASDVYQCVMKQVAANVDLVQDIAEGDNNVFTTQMRARRGEFIIKYDATDRAGNKASQLVFAMIMIDDECPCPTGPALPDVEAMDSCDAILPFKEGGKIGTVVLTECKNFDRSQIVLDEKKISWNDNYDEQSPTMANAGYDVRKHGLKYSISHEAGRVVNSNHGSASDIDQAVYDMTLADAVAKQDAQGSADVTVAYTTKDYANIFGTNYADNECVNGIGASDCSGVEAPPTAWAIKDTLAPRIFANPNLDADGAGAGTEEVTTCGAPITLPGVPVPFTDPNGGDSIAGGRIACHAWNIRRRWCAATLSSDGTTDATIYDNLDKCVGWNANQLFAVASPSATADDDPRTLFDCHQEVAKAHHECGEAYKEPGYVCIDMRDSFSAASTGTYPMTITGVNDAATICNDYHVKDEATCMHHTPGKDGVDDDRITYALADGSAAGPAITSASKARLGTDFELTSTAQSSTGYPLYGKNGECETDFTATYTCTDAVEQTVSITRTITVKDTVNPTLEIATAGMNIINTQESTYAIGVNTTGEHAHGLYNNGKTSFTDSTHMDDKTFDGGRRNVQDTASYVNNKATIAGDWHGDHTAANTYKNMNSHYHEQSIDSEISSGTVGNSVNRRNFAGKTWTLKTQTSVSGVQDSYVIQHSSGFDADEAVITNLVKAHKGFACYDACDGDLTHAMTSGSDNTGYNATGTNLDHGAKNGVTMSWHEHDAALECGVNDANRAALDGQGGRVDGFNTLIPGTYVLKYVCEDECGNTDTKCRTILNEDHTKPVITVLEADEQTYEATRNDNYVDAGATCSDEVDGNISQDVEVSGDVVNLARVGVYTIKYNCQDSASNEADEATRTVTVQDTSCPSCIVSADSTETTQYHEFTTSIEASFPYSDAGAVAQDTLQGSFGICSVWGLEGGTTAYGMKTSYKNIVNVERTGTYVITYRVKDSNGNWNDMTTANDGCTGGQTDGENKRTVVIIDTLRPVIELKYKGTADAAPTIIHRGAHEFVAGDATGRGTGANLTAHPDETSWVATHVGAVHDPSLKNRQYSATDHSAADNGRYQDGEFMAEESATTAVNGWVIGAVASAVSGLALLGYSLRKSAAPVATSVPV